MAGQSFLLAQERSWGGWWLVLSKLISWGRVLGGKWGGKGDDGKLVIREPECLKREESDVRGTNEQSGLPLSLHHCFRHAVSPRLLYSCAGMRGKTGTKDVFDQEGISTGYLDISCDVYND